MSQGFFLNFVLLLCEFNIMHPNSTHLHVPLYLPFTLITCPKKEKASCGSCSVSQISHSIHFVHISLLRNARRFCLVQGLWLLLHYQYWILIGTLGYPIVALCPGDLKALESVYLPAQARGESTGKASLHAHSTPLQTSGEF